MAGQPRSLAPGERLTLAIVLGGFAALLFYQGWLWRGDLLVYDTQLQLLSRPASDDIVIIAIDQQSLDTFGRWPWRRDIHATLLDRLAVDADQGDVQYGIEGTDFTACDGVPIDAPGQYQSDVTQGDLNVSATLFEALYGSVSGSQPGPSQDGPVTSADLSMPKRYFQSALS